MTFGTRLTELRKAKGISQEALGRGMGPGGSDVTKQTVSNWEKDRFIPNIEQVPLLSDRLGCSTDYLLTGRPNTVALSSDVAAFALMVEQLPQETRRRVLPMWAEMAALYAQKKSASSEPTTIVSARSASKP